MKTFIRHACNTTSARSMTASSRIDGTCTGRWLLPYSGTTCLLAIIPHGAPCKQTCGSGACRCPPRTARSAPPRSSPGARAAAERGRGGQASALLGGLLLGLLRPSPKASYFRTDGDPSEHNGAALCLSDAPKTDRRPTPCSYRVLAELVDRK